MASRSGSWCGRSPSVFEELRLRVKLSFRRIVVLNDVLSVSVPGVIVPLILSVLGDFAVCARGPVRRADLLSMPTVLALRLLAGFSFGVACGPLSFGTEEVKGETACRRLFESFKS